MDYICSRAWYPVRHIYHWWCRYKVLKFGVVGGIGSLISLSVLFVFTEYAGLHYLISYLIAGTCAITSNYLLHTLWTFKQKKGIKGYIRYTLISWATTGLSKGIILVVLTELGLWYMISAAIATFIGFIVNYTLCRRLVWQG